MIYGIGVDLVKISRIKKAVDRWGDRFIKKVFTEKEIKICNSRPRPINAFALRFAAKEAFSKAVGFGMRQGIRWKDIEVFHYPTGKPGIRLYGKCLKICEENGLNNVHISLSDEGDYGIALVILEKTDEASTYKQFHK